MGSCVVWKASVGWKGETKLAKERLPFWGKVWYNGTAEGKNAAGSSGLRLRLAGPRCGFSLIIAAQIMTVIVSYFVYMLKTGI